MEIVLIITIGVVLVAAFGSNVLKDRAHMEHIARLERLVAAKDLGEAAAVERMFASPPASEERAPRKPDEADELWATPPKPKERRT